MQAGKRCLPDRVEVEQVGLPVVIHHDSPAGVVGRRYHGDRLFGDVDTEFQTAGFDRREMFADELGRLVADIQIEAVAAEALHFMVDGPGHNVARRQFGALVEPGHEAFATGQAQIGAFTTQRFGNQKGFGPGVVEACRVKLVELHVGDPAARPPGHGNAVTTGAVGVAGVQIDLAGAPGGQYHHAGLKHMHMVVAPVERIGAGAAQFG